MLRSFHELADRRAHLFPPMLLTRSAILVAPIKLAVIACFALGGIAPQPLRAQSSPASVVVAPVVEREVSTGHRVVGTVLPVRKSTVGCAVDGRVTEFLVDLGDAVKAGQPLAKLRTGTLEIELASANAELRLRKEELAELQNGSRPEDIAEARAKMLGAKAAEQNAHAQLARIESLFKRNAINEMELDDARTRAEAARQTLKATEALLRRIEAGPRREQIAQAQAQVELQQEQVRLIEDRIAKFTIYAPFDGYITAEHTEVGEWINQGDPIAEVVSLEQVDVRANVPAEQAVQLQRGGEVRIEFPELPDVFLSGPVTQVVPTADMRTRTFPVTIRLSNPKRNGFPLLMGGMLVRAILPTGEPTRMPLVPKDALVLNRGQRSVFVVERSQNGGETSIVREVPVYLGVADGKLIQIDAPLQAGDLVVVLGNERLQDGQSVRTRQLVVELEEAAE